MTRHIDMAWGMAGLRHALPHSDVVVIVDVLSFSTAVDIAVARGGRVYPYHLDREGAARFAENKNAVLAHPRSAAGGQFSLSPQSLDKIEAGTRLVLPSPNGSALSAETGQTTTIAGCLRNASAVSQAVDKLGQRISIIAAGERWPDHSLRPALEDLLGAGAIIAGLDGVLSVDAQAALTIYTSLQATVQDMIIASPSGEELRNAGYGADVDYATATNVSQTVPILREGAYECL